MSKTPYDPNTFWGTIAKRVDRDYTKKFLFAGNCRFTLVNADTGARLTYRIRKPKSIKFHPFQAQVRKYFDYSLGHEVQYVKPWCQVCYKPEPHPFHWVSPEGESMFRVEHKVNLDPTDNKGWESIGYLTQADGKHQFIYWQRSKVKQDNPAIKTMPWFLEHLQADTLPDKLWVYHMGCCARCGKALDVPTSIEAGFGPECIDIINGKAA